MSPDVFSKMNAGKVLLSAGLIIPVVFSLSFSKTDVPLFLLSGQSNMTGMQNSINDLTTEQKKSVENVKIYMDMGTAAMPEGDGAKKRKWLTLGPGFGSDVKGLGLGPELFLGRILSDSMPDTKLAIVKYGIAGTYLGKSTEWLPPSSGGPGPYYKNMMAHIDTALKKFNDAYDTTKYAPRWAGFVWLQGEFDAMDANLSNKYEENLTNLIKDIRTKTGVADLPIILPMIDVQNIWTNNAKVRAADIAVAKKIENCDTLDTKGFPSNGIHYSASGQVKIGTLCAQRWFAMKYLDVTVPVINRQNNISSHIPSFGKITTSFDLKGRKMVQLPAGVSGNKVDRPAYMIINVDGTRAEKVLQIWGRTCAMH